MRNKFLNLTFSDLLLNSIILIVFIFGLSVGIVDNSLVILQLAFILAPLLYLICQQYITQSNEISIAWWHFVLYILLFGFGIVGGYVDFRLDLASEFYYPLHLSFYVLAVIILSGSILHTALRMKGRILSERSPSLDLIVLLLIIMMVMAILSVLKLCEILVDGLVDNHSIDSSIYMIGFIFLILVRRICYSVVGTSNVAVWQNYHFMEKEEFPLEEDCENQIIEPEMFQLARNVEVLLMDDNYYLNPFLSLDMISEKSRIPKHKLSRLFNEYYQNGFYHLIAEYRIRHATMLLMKDKDITMDALSEICGFNSKSTFYKYFKEFNGTTPYEFVRSPHTTKIKEEINAV